MVERLRAAGFPADVVRGLAEVKLKEVFYARRLKVAEKMAPKPYWDSKFGQLDREAMSEMNALNREQARAIHDLLGTDNRDNDPIDAVFTRNMNAGLSPQDADRVQTIQSDYADLEGQIYLSLNGAPTPEDTEKLAYLEREKEADLAKALSPEELLDYQLRSSPNASTLRNNLKSFHPSEDEFRAIFKAQQAFDSQYGSTSVPLTQEQSVARQSHQADLTAAIQQVLSPDRFADYKTETDPLYVQVDQVVQRLDLPPGTTAQVFSMQSGYMQQATDIRQDSSLSPADKASKLAALADEATDQLTTALGPNGLAAYKQNGGWWLQALKPQGK